MKASEKKIVRILVVEDHPVVREGLVSLLNREPGFTVCCEADSVQDAIGAFEKGGPDLVIVDLILRRGDGLDLVKQIRALDRKTPVLVLSMQDESLYAERALRAGASGYIMKLEASRELVNAIRTVLSGDIYVSRKMNVRLLHRVLDPNPGEKESMAECLTDRELHVFQMIGSGLGTGQIAKELGLSAKTIESHRENIKNKLGIATGAELVQRAVNWVETAKTPAS